MHTLKKLQSKLLRIGFFLKQLRMERKKKGGGMSSVKKIAKDYFVLGDTHHLLKERTYPCPNLSENGNSLLP